MYLSASAVGQFFVSSVLLSVLQCSSAVRFSRSMRYPVPSVRKYYFPWNFVPFGPLPSSMQRRFMWKEMDDTVDELMDGVATGARAMTHIFTPPVVRYRKPAESEPQPTMKVKYVLKKAPPPFKRMKIIKLRAPKKTIQIYKPPVPVVDAPVAAPLISSKPNLIVPYMSEEELRKIEKEQEKRVESALNAASGFHEHTHQTHVDNDVVSGRINEFGAGWLPIKAPFSTPKPFAVSQLHTHIYSGTVPPPRTLAPPLEGHSYEVTEHSAEESMHEEQAFKPTNNFEFLGPTTVAPNYPEHFLKSVQESVESFKPKRVHTLAPPTTTTTTSVSPTLAHRLPPRTTTERPFKRYNLHRPKSSKLFFHKATSSSPPLQITSSTTEQTVAVISEVVSVIQEPVKTTRESIRTTREPLKPTKESVKAPAEKVRTTRNNSEAKTKIRIKNTTQNEGLSKILNQHRGTVKFGEKQS